MTRLMVLLGYGRGSSVASPGIGSAVLMPVKRGSASAPRGCRTGLFSAADTATSGSGSARHSRRRTIWPNASWAGPSSTTRAGCRGCATSHLRSCRSVSCQGWSGRRFRRRGPIRVGSDEPSTLLPCTSRRRTKGPRRRTGSGAGRPEQPARARERGRDASRVKGAPCRPAPALDSPRVAKDSVRVCAARLAPPVELGPAPGDGARPEVHGRGEGTARHQPIDRGAAEPGRLYHREQAGEEARRSTGRGTTGRG